MTTPRPLPKRARREEQASILSRALDLVRSAPRPALAIFDLDSTLLDNRPRQARILREFGEKVKNLALASCQAHHVDGWDLKVAMRNAGLSPDEVERLFPGARAFWKGRFFTSEYCVEDVPTPGAREFLQKILSEGGTIAYVTGRDVYMGPGTLQNFRAHGFPLPDEERVHLLLKPAHELGDDAWKEKAHLTLKTMGKVVVAFDNEPSHINGYFRAFPGIFAVHLDTDHSGRPVEVHEQIPSIADFLLEEGAR